MAARLENEVKSRTLQRKNVILMKAPVKIYNDGNHAEENGDGLTNDMTNRECGLQENGNRNDVLDVAKVSELFSSVFSALNSPREEALPTLKMVQACVKCSLWKTSYPFLYCKLIARVSFTLRAIIRPFLSTIDLGTSSVKAHTINWEHR